MNSMGGFTGFADNTGASLRRGGKSGDIIPKGYRAGQLQQFTPQQMQLFNSLFSHAGPGSFLSKLAGGDEETFSQIEAPALRQFGELQGNLASRFSNFGGTGATRSSGFQNTMNQATSDFAMQLASQRQGLQRQALLDLLGMSESLLGQRPYERLLTQKQQQKSPGFLGSLFQSAPKETMGAFGGALQGAVGGGMAGGPMGALLGGLGGLASSWLSK